MSAKHGFPPTVVADVERALSSQLAPNSWKAERVLEIMWKHLQTEQVPPSVSVRRDL